MNTSINLKREFEKILDKYGREVLVIRQDKKLFCSCYNEVNQEASRDCPLCLGLGFSLVAERHRTRSESSASAEQMLKQLKFADIGDVSVNKRKYFFKANMNAIQKDLIAEVKFDAFGRPAYTGDGIWEIENMDRNLHLEEGNQIFKVYQTSENPVRSKIRSIRISEMNGIKQYSVLLEG
ncbi:hypothetical protein [Cytobacillus oceanisediminis]|uniref:hypothetical protein n=1 Tax=Cytobacillus oceanisediminis TaxID=665099 RepID=UPI001FB37988|nr:hypothetical protein [Cytobacillus oceanisediminis]UOE58089.1 hypothetical protein IRB79_26605 [Cytobacillus oceanisediminis]